MLQAAGLGRKVGCQGGQAPLAGGVGPWCHPCYGWTALGLLYRREPEEQ